MNNESSPTAVIIGGSGGIGSALAQRLFSKGWKLILAARDLDRLKVITTQTNAELFALDARDGSAVEAFFEQLKAEHQRIDGVVNCAGSILLKPAHLISDAEFADTMALNLTTAFNTLRGAVKVMMKQPGGSIVLCSSVAAKRGLVNHEAIAAAKAGIEGMALSAAASYAKFGIRVNCVAPGLTRTGLTKKLTDNETVAKMSAAMHPLGRIGEASEVASAIAWLLDAEQTWVTGQVIGVDGGMGSVQARS